MAKGQLRIRILGDDSDLSNKLQGVSGKLGKFALAAGAAVAAGGAAAAVGLFKIGESFDSAYDTIRVGTGATGEALGALQKDFKEVVKSVPADFETASTAVADLNTRLGLTGEPLQEMSTQFLELSRITETDVATNIAAVTRAFGDWEVATEDQSATLDMMFRAAQASGATVDGLATSVVQFGAPLRQVGFSLEDSVAMFAAFEKAGVNVQTMMPGIRFALKTFIAEGRDPAQALRETFEGIQDGTITATDALSLFGQRAGADMVEAIKQGRFELSDLTAALSNGSETIIGAGADTQDFAEKWLMFKNRVMVALEPVAIRVFDAIGNAMDTLGPKVSTIIEDFGPKLSAVFAAIGEWWDANGPTIVGHVGTIAEAVGGFVSGALKSLGEWWDDNGQAVISTAQRIADVVGTALTTAFSLLSAAFTGLSTAASFVASNWSVLGPILMGVGGIILATLIPHWIALGVQASVSAAQSVAAWVAQSTAGIVHGARILGTFAAMIAQGAVWIATHVAQAAVFVAQWVLMGVQSLLHAAKVALAWLIAMGPIALVIAAVVGLVALIIANWDKIVRFTRDLWTKVTGFFKRMRDNVVSFARNLVIKTAARIIDLRDRIVSAVRRIRDRFVEGFRSLRDGAVRWATNLVNWVKGLPGKILRGIGNVGRALWNKGRDLIQGFINGIKNTAGRIITTIKDFVTDAIPGFVKRALGISSPSKVMMALGEDTVMGLQAGLNSMTPTVPLPVMPNLSRMDLPGLSAMANTIARHQLEMAAPPPIPFGSMPSVGGADRPIEVRVDLDGREVARTIVDPMARELYARDRRGSRVLPS